MVCVSVIDDASVFCFLIDFLLELPGTMFPSTGVVLGVRVFREGDKFGAGECFPRGVKVGDWSEM